MKHCAHSCWGISCSIALCLASVGCRPSGDTSTPDEASQPSTASSDDEAALPAVDTKASAHGDAAATPYLLAAGDPGRAQSPINILTKESESKHHSVKFHYQFSPEKVLNLGHTVEVDFESGGTVEFDGRLYDFKQFHFHTPAEHLIDGITYPMEMHLVHKAHDDPNSYLVIGVMFKEGERSGFLDAVLPVVPAHAGETRAVTDHPADVTTMVGERDGFYHYRGSLTTAPYTESVEWLVDKIVHEASPEQVETINRIEGNNARHVQATNGRHVDTE